MTALWLEPDLRPVGPVAPVGAPDLRLLGSGLPVHPDEFDSPDRDEALGLRLVEAPVRSGGRPRRRTSMAVRRRRTLLAAMALLVVVLALPLSGTGGHSHATGSALAGANGVTTYTVKPGDTLWTIAEQVAPTADPRPLVAQMAARIGSETVVPGERIVVP
jgi:nucleoid-associated protein YgaU